MGGSRNIAVGLGAAGVIVAFALFLFLKPLTAPAIAQGTSGGTLSASPPAAARPAMAAARATAPSFARTN
jgi:hypothetical protein